MIHYEDLSNVDRTKSVFSAEQAIETGWIRRGYPAIDLDEIPWALTNDENRSWNFYIHSWDMLDSQLKAYGETNDVKFLSVSTSIVKDWIDYIQSSPPEDLSPMTWYDMSVGLRAYRLAYLIDATERAGVLTDDGEIFWSTLDKHRQQLADDNNIVFHNNHGFYQVAGQLAMGRRFSDRSSLMAQAYEQGQDRLQQMLEQQFSEDGIHREHSPDYHRMVYETLKSLISSGLVVRKETVAFSKKIESALSWFVLPDQHIANFGDSDFRLMARKPAEAQRKWSSPDMQFVVSNGQVGHLPDEIFKVFTDGGYAVVRKANNSTPANLKQFSYLAQTAAFHSRTHKHADDLSFLWSDHGSNILVDAGRYGYIGKAEQGSDLWLDGYWYSDPTRVYCESTRAHNTLEFDNLNYPRKGVKPYGVALKRSLQDNSGIVVIETEAKHFKSIRRARILIFKPGKWLLVLDWFHDNNQLPHNVKQWFHLSPELSILDEKNGYVIPIPSSKPLRVKSLLTAPKKSRLIIGENKPLKQGWWSPKEKDIVSNYTFCFELDDANTGQFATIFSFTENLNTNPGWSKVNVSGRSWKIKWIDDEGIHELNLERPAVGNMTVSYNLSND